MIPKKKAEDLWLTYYELLPDGIYSNEAAKAEAKRFALIAVSEAEKSEYNVLTKFGFVTNNYTSDYWQQVKSEIEGL